jgi:class 3 adenylate cyclase/YHS domain-containing protein
VSDATFAFVDLAGFTALTEAHGDEEAVAIVQAFRDRVLDVLGPDDELVKVIGDAVMLRFPTCAAAVRALRALLSADGSVLLPRAGAHHGSAVAVEGDYYGAAVNLASRVAAEAAGGQLLVTTAVAMAARDEGAVVTHVGAVSLRNVADPVDVYDVRVTEDTHAVAVDPVCRMRVPTQGDDRITLQWSGRTLHFCGLPCVARFAASPESFGT